MHIAAVVVSVVLALSLLASGIAKIVRAPRIVVVMEAVGVTAAQLPLLGALQVAATIGLIVGIWIVPLGIAAAVGLVLYFSGAIAAHIRAHDPGAEGAILFLTFSLVTLALLILSATLR